jgi:hypothetical protein
MATVKKWSFASTRIEFGKELTEAIVVDSAIMDSDVQCFHCGKNIKMGKLVFCGKSFMKSPSSFGENDWGAGNKRTFCSSNHAKLFAKNNS